VAAINSSIQFNKKNFWIDPVSHNQYFVGVQYLESDIRSIETLLNIPLPVPRSTIPCRCGTSLPSDAQRSRPRSNHTTLQATIDLTMGVYGRDLGHVADDVARRDRHVRTSR